MAGSTDRNVEYEVLQWATDKLHNAFRSSIKTMAGRFYADKLLTTEVKRSCSDGTDSCVEAMVSNLQERVYNDPPAYYNILKIIESETGVSYIVKHLEGKRSEIEQERKKAEEERKREIERRSAFNTEFKKDTIHLQESGGQGGMGLHGRPTKLPTFTTAAPTMNSYQAPTRNIIAPSFHHRTGPAAYNQPYHPTMPFNKQQTPSNGQAGDTFPLPAISPEYMLNRSHPADSTMSSMTTIPAQRKQSEHNLESLGGRLATINIVTGMTMSRVTDHSMNKQPQCSQSAELVETTAGPTEQDAEHHQNIEGTNEGTKDDPKAAKNTNGRNFRSSRDSEPEIRQEKETSHSSSGINNEHTNFASESFRRDSTSSIESDTFQSFGSASGSLTSSIDSRGSPRHRQKRCNKCHFYKKQLEELEGKVSELERKNQKLTNDLCMQQHHSTEQIESYRHELSKREDFLTVSQHRHQEMELKMHWLQNKIAELEQATPVQALIAEIETLRQERDRERNEKEKERLQKERECAEKEKERVLHEREREQRILLQKELFQIRVLLTRTKSLTCDEQEIFIWNNVEGSGNIMNEAFDYTRCQQQLPLTVAPLPGQSDINIDQRVPKFTPNVVAEPWSVPNTGTNLGTGQWSAPNTGTNVPAKLQGFVNPGTNLGAGPQGLQNIRTNPPAEQWNASIGTNQPVEQQRVPFAGTNLPAGQWMVPNLGTRLQSVQKIGTNLQADQWSAPIAGTNLPAEQWSAPNTETNLGAGPQRFQSIRTKLPAEQWSAPVAGTNLEATGLRSVQNTRTNPKAAQQWRAPNAATNLGTFQMSGHIGTNLATEPGQQSASNCSGNSAMEQ